ncbi:Ycf66 family protein [Myxosarcina sp. GI1(2024)]
MVNFGLNSASILGIFLAVAGASLYFMRSVRPELSRDHDIFFAAVGLLCGFILLFQGWRLDPILQFGQFLLTGSAVFFAVESIRLRGVATEQARRNTPTVDRDRPVSRSRVYTEAELDKFNSDEYEGTPNYDSPRLRGYEEPYPRSARRPSEARTAESRYTDYSYSEPAAEPPTRSRSSRSRNSRPERYEATTDARPRRRKSSPPRHSEVYEEGQVTARNESSQTSSRPRRRNTRDDGYSDSPVFSRRSKANPADLGRSYDADLGRDYEPDLGKRYDADLGRKYDDDYADEYEDEVISTDYVDYQPLEDSETDYPEDRAGGRPIAYSDEQQSTREDRPRPNNPIDLDY